jgi:hypothetical protein
VNIDHALTTYRGELISGAQRWQVARNRHRRRLLFASSALALAAVIVGTAVAATGWLVGSPAPPSVKSDFGSYAPQLGFNPEPGKAVLVASDGAYKMYVTPDKQGGYCTLVSDPWYHPGPQGSGGDCNSRQQASVAFLAGPVGAGPTSPASDGGTNTKMVIAGRTRNSAAKRVRFTTPNRKMVTTPLGTSGFFITPITVHRPKTKPGLVMNGIAPGICHWTTTFVLLDAAGRPLSRQTRTFGPRICLRAPHPAVTRKNGTTIFTLTPGQIGFLANAHPGDKIACQIGDQTLSLIVPEASVGRQARPHDRLQSSLHVRRGRDGRIWVLCQ